MDEQTQRHWAECAVRAVNQVVPFQEVAPWPHSQRYLPQALLCDELITHSGIMLAEAARLLNSAGSYLRDRGQYQEAEPLFLHALTIEEKRYGRDHPNTLYLLNNLALLYRNQGKYEEAAPLYQRALAIREKRLGPEHPDTERVRKNYTNLLQKMGQKTGGDQQH